MEKRVKKTHLESISFHYDQIQVSRRIKKKKAVTHSDVIIAPVPLEAFEILPFHGFIKSFLLFN